MIIKNMTTDIALVFLVPCMIIGGGILAGVSGLQEGAHFFLEKRIPTLLFGLSLSLPAFFGWLATAFSMAAFFDDPFTWGNIIGASIMTLVSLLCAAALSLISVICIGYYYKEIIGSILEDLLYVYADPRWFQPDYQRT